MLAPAFVKRDFLIATSYKTNFFVSVSRIFVVVPLLYFAGEFVDESEIGILKGYGGSYFAFLLIGVAFVDYLSLSLRTFTSSLRESQLMGTLEIVLLSPVQLSKIMIYSSLWAYVFATFRVLVYLVLGLLFGMRLDGGNIVLALGILVLAITSFASVGMLIATITMIIKQADALVVLVRVSSFFLGGVMYPIAVLPDWVQLLSKFLPITYALEAMRLSLLESYSAIDLLPQIGALVLFSVILLPLSLFGFAAAVRVNKITGTLAQY